MSPLFIALFVYLAVALPSALFLGAVLGFSSASDDAEEGIEASDELETFLAAQPVEA